MSGWVKLHRQLQMNRLWLSEPFTRGQAWIDLILLANHKDARVSARGISIAVPRGSVGWSKQKLADRWRWSKGKVNRFLNELEIDQQVVQSTGQSLTVISLCNYDKFNAMTKVDSTVNGTTNGPQNGTTNDTQSGTAGGTQDGSLTRSKEVKEVKKNNNSNGSSEKFQAFKNQLILLGHNEISIGRTQASIGQINQWVRDGVSEQELADGIAQAVIAYQKKGDSSTPSLPYIATVIRNIRLRGNVIGSGDKKLNTHGDFDETDYLEGTEGMTVIGGKQ